MKRYVLGMNQAEGCGYIILASIPIDESNMGRQIVKFDDTQTPDMATLIGYANSGITAIEGEDGEPRDVGKIVNSQRESGTFSMDHEGNTEKISGMSEDELAKVFKRHGDKDPIDVQFEKLTRGGDAKAAGEVIKAMAGGEAVDPAAFKRAFPIVHEVKTVCNDIAQFIIEKVEKREYTNKAIIDNGVAMLMGRMLAKASSKEARDKLYAVIHAGEVSTLIEDGKMTEANVDLMNESLAELRHLTGKTN